MSDWLISDCPYCGNTTRLPAHQAGSEMACPACRRVFLPLPNTGETPVNKSNPSKWDKKRAEKQSEERVRVNTLASENDEVPVQESNEWDGGTELNGPIDNNPDNQSIHRDTLPHKKENPPLAQSKKINWAEPKVEGVDETQSEWAEFPGELRELAEGEDTEGSVRMKKRRFEAKPEVFQWDESAEMEKPKSKWEGKILWFAAVFMIFSIGFLLFFMFATSGRTGDAQAASPPVIAPIPKAGEAQGPGFKLVDPTLVLPKLIPVIENFLKAKNFEERLLYVRNPDRTRRLMEQYYKEQTDAPVRWKAIARDKQIAYRENFLVVEILFEDYSTKQIAVEMIDGEYKIDWESFVGFGEMEPESFLKEKPISPKLMRVALSAAHPPYFNFTFADEANLECFLLSFNDESFIFGYVPKHSYLNLKLKSLLTFQNTAKVVLKLRYPEDAKAANQVWIHELVSEGWVINETKKP